MCRGTFVNGLLEGPGVTYYLNGKVLYEGEFHEGKAMGIGYVNEESGKETFVGKDESVFREALLEGLYEQRQEFKKFESKTYFDKVMERKAFEKQRKTSPLKDDKIGKTELSMHYRRKKVDEYEQSQRA